MLRVLRMLKMLRIIRNHKFIEQLYEKLNINFGIIRMINLNLVMIFMVHMSACLWHLLATLDDDIQNTWVNAGGLLEEDPGYKYLYSFYWAFQTVTAVGFGDLHISTNAEYMFTLIWMVIGVNFYSYLIGNITSIISILDSRSASLTSRISTLNMISSKHKFPQATYNKIRKYFENSSKNNSMEGDWQKMFHNFPLPLRSEVIQQTHGKIIDKIMFFKDKSQDFLINIIPRLKIMNLFDNDILFNEGDQAEEIFFI